MSPEPTSSRWQLTQPPTGQHCWTWHPAGLADLTRVRREFQANLADPGSDRPLLDADQVTWAVLALDELMSNALRHGRAPVEVRIEATTDGYLLHIQDQAAQDPPAPTTTRDPSDGGMGLGIVADTALSCGWYPTDHHKTVWALLPCTSALTPHPFPTA